MERTWSESADLSTGKRAKSPERTAFAAECRVAAGGTPMRRFLIVALVFALMACSSSSPKFGGRPATIARPDIDVRQLSVPFFGSGYTAPLPLDVDITNRSSVPLNVRRVRVEATGMSEYS